jgi:hypothetical protein
MEWTLYRGEARQRVPLDGDIRRDGAGSVGPGDADKLSLLLLDFA